MKQLPMTVQPASSFADYAAALQRELHAICGWWQQHMPDSVYGGFLGAIDASGAEVPQAPKGAVLNARLLYTFSAAYAATAIPGYLEMAKRACEAVTGPFIDPAHGGVFWTLDAYGKPLETKKQIYAQAFAIYGLATYHTATQDESALQAAIRLFALLEKHAFDPQFGGYTEALDARWQPIADVRLSAKDEQAVKTMNTHLHVLEAYTALYRIWPDGLLAERLNHLLDCFFRHIIDHSTGHLKLFFDERWQGSHRLISYGHDIEAAWLLHEAAEVLGSAHWLEETAACGLRMAEAAARGLDKDGGLWYEMDTATGQLVAEKHWWPQAEAMVGFWHAGMLSGDDHWRQKSIRSWQFVEAHLLDRNGGEWFWGIDARGQLLPNQDKAGLWKCPYHNGRACLELLRRMGVLPHSS